MNTNNQPSNSFEKPKNPDSIPKNIEKQAQQQFPQLVDSIASSYNETQKNIGKISQDTRFKILGGNLSTSNDNHITTNGIQGSDDGHTFGFDGNIVFEYNNKPFNLSASMDSYTSLPKRVSQKTWKWYYSPDSNRNGYTKERVDRAIISLDTKQNLLNTENTTIDLKYGAGLSYTWDLGGQKIQNSWHKARGLNYHIKAPYEKKNLGIGGHVNLGIDAQRKIWEYVYVGAKLDSRINAFGSGNTHLEGTAYAGIKTKYAAIEWGVGKTFYDSDTSPTINFSKNSTQNIHNYVRASLGTENVKMFYEVTTKNHWKWMIGVSIGKKF